MTTFTIFLKKFRHLVYVVLVLSVELTGTVHAEEQGYMDSARSILEEAELVTGKARQVIAKIDSALGQGKTTEGRLFRLRTKLENQLLAMSITVGILRNFVNTSNSEPAAVAFNIGIVKQQMLDIGKTIRQVEKHLHPLGKRQTRIMV